LAGRLTAKLSRVVVTGTSYASWRPSNDWGTMTSVYPADGGAFVRRRAFASSQHSLAAPAALILLTVVILSHAAPNQFTQPYMWIEDGFLTLRAFLEGGRADSLPADERLSDHRLETHFLHRLHDVSPLGARDRGRPCGRLDLRRRGRESPSRPRICAGRLRARSRRCWCRRALRSSGFRPMRSGGPDCCCFSHCSGTRIADMPGGGSPSL